jgi:hypothetical protein
VRIADAHSFRFPRHPVQLSPALHGIYLNWMKSMPTRGRLSRCAPAAVRFGYNPGLQPGCYR